MLLDISGGDSFSDIYGEQRLAAICCPKERMMQLGKRFILLPQTYGPFRKTESRDRAERIVRHATACWARDRDSFEVLKELLGNEFNPAIHRQGVDVAFLLPTHAPSPSVASEVEALRANQRGLIGLNISGLVYNTPEQSKAEFQLKADYRQAVHNVVQRLLDQSEHRIALISHVFGGTHRDSDPPAARAVYEQLSPQQRERVWVAPAFSDPREIKWMISQCDWFCGTRMHATIAGLSSGVPTASIAYSMKTRGVFESCGVADQVIDPRHKDTEEVIERTVQSFHDRESTRKRLAEALPATLAIAEQQMDDIAEMCRQSVSSALCDRQGH
jgi:polysaccharide pyruvyl transferase WcaK-like protein